MKIFTLCLVHNNSQILLGYKKRGFGAGWWNGFGGKVLKNEAIETAAKRELLEECGLTAQNLIFRAVLHFHFENDPEELEVHLFEVNDYDGEPIETDEMKPQWFYQNEIPFDKMWPDDRFWFPYFLDGKNFTGHFLFLDQNHMVDYKIIEA